MMRKLENPFFVKLCLLKHWNTDMQFSRYWLRERKPFSGTSFLGIPVKIHPNLAAFGSL